MKRKLSVTIERNTVRLMEGMVREGRFRNKSHVLEYAVGKLIKGGKNAS